MLYVCLLIVFRMYMYR